MTSPLVFRPSAQPMPVTFGHCEQVSILARAPVDFRGAHADLVAMTGPPVCSMTAHGIGGSPPAPPLTPRNSGAKPAPYSLDFLRLGIPVSGGALRISRARENTLNYLLQSRAAKGKLYLPKSRSGYNRVLHRLLRAAGMKPDGMRLFIIEDDSPNACWVRGTDAIFVTTGLLRKPDFTEGELAYVLGHEIGHFLKNRPGLVVPGRFKNPLFRRFVQETHAARGQTEEYQSDEIGLLIADAAGYSVDEGLEVERWLAGATKKKKAAASSGTRVLRPGETHPHDDARIGVVTETIEGPRFVWHNRGVTRRPLDFKNSLLQKQKCDSRVGDIPPSDPLDITIVAAFARRPFREEHVFDDENIVCLLFHFLREKKIDPDRKTGQIIGQLREDAREGDLVARAYLQALLSRLYLDAVGKGESEARERLVWLEGTCRIAREEVLLALIEYLESSGHFRSRIISVYDKDLYSETVSPSHELNLKEMVSPFPYSDLRDRLIGALLRFLDHIRDQGEFVERHILSSKEGISLPFSKEVLTDRGEDLLRLLHGLSIVNINGFVTGDVVVVSQLSDYVRATAGPYDRGELEANLADDFEFQRLAAIDPKFFDQKKTCDDYRKFEERAREFSEPFLSGRILGFARIVLLRCLEQIPTEYWEDETISLIESLPPSSERNHLLILLIRAGKRAFRAEDFIFREIPSPDESGALGDAGSLLHAFGFIGTGGAESVYPSGQRVLDRLMADRFPPSGPLSLKDILRDIPRPSPFRDDLLDRCVADNAAGAHPLLDAYWSPAAAYAKAYDLSSRWLSVSGGDRNVFQEILEITGEFPSLRRRMVAAWTDRFGIEGRDYELLLRAAQDVDAIDLYRGGAVEQSREATCEHKAALCLASFASALARGGYSLLSLQVVDSGKKRRPPRSRSAEDLMWSPPEKIDEGKIDRADAQRRLFDDYHPLLPENAARIASLLYRGRRCEIHPVPFVDDHPVPNPRFTRKNIVHEGLSGLSRWEGGRAFFRFMSAMGWEGATAFYEELLLGREGAMKDTDLSPAMEKIFLEGIGLLLEEKKVPLSRVQNIRKGLGLLLARQSLEVRGRIWARILAGIVQGQPLGEIVREAVRPLGAAGTKLMQAVHSLTMGVDATLEDATRLAIDQTARFTLFDSLQFLGSRGISPFDCHQRYQLLGQGSVRAAIAGLGGPVEDSAYLLVHASAPDPRVVQGIVKFIGDMDRKGQYFPLRPDQFRDLAEETDTERRAGFENHQAYGEHYEWSVGELHIPRLYECHGDWARAELVTGVPYGALPAGDRPAMAALVIGAALSQIVTPAPSGMFLINPEMHGGNVLCGQGGWLIDCGLVENSTREDIEDMSHAAAGYRYRGIPGAVAALLARRGIQDWDGLAPRERPILLSGLGVYEDRDRMGIPFELLLPGLAEITLRSLGERVPQGLNILFRAFQHLAPYIRDLTKEGEAARAAVAPFAVDVAAYSIATDRGEWVETVGRIASQMERSRGAGSPDSSTQALRPILPKGIVVGKANPNGSIQAGVLTEPLDPGQVETEGRAKGMLACRFENFTRFIRPEDLRIQRQRKDGTLEWIALEEWR